MATISEKEITEKIKLALKKVLGCNPAQISATTVLVDDLGMDSFASLELMFELEDELGLKIPDEDAKKFQTVGDVARYAAGVLSK